MSGLHFLGGMGVGIAIAAPWPSLQIIGFGQAMLCLWAIRSSKTEERDR